jgi:hypothetical protein
MERAIERLNALEKKLLAMNVLEEYTIPEVARMYAEDGRAVPARCAGPALADPACGWFDGTITLSYGGSKTCQEGKNYNFDLSDTNQGGNIEKLALQPASDLIS